MSNTVTSRRPGYGRLLRTPRAWTFFLPGLAARQPFAMLTIGMVLLVEHTTGSYGTAGAVAAVAGVAMALAAPRGGRLADRFGQAAVLVPGVLAHAASVALLAALALAHAPLWALFAAAVPAGATVPQVGPMVRARWAARLEGSPLAATAAAFESVTDEFTFVIGPVLTTALCTGVHPAAGLAAEGLLTVVGGLLFAAQRSTQPLPGRDAPRPGTGSAQDLGRTASALAVPGVRVLVVAFLGIGTVFGGLQVSLTAFATETGHPALNGVLYGVFASGTMIGGAVCGAVAWRVSARRRLLVAYTGLALLSSLLWAAHAPLVLAGLGMLVGLCLAPALISGYTLVAVLVPATARTEAFTWLAGAAALGQAAAMSVAGQLADRFGAAAGFLVPLSGTALALLTVVLLRGSLATSTSGRIAARGPGSVGQRMPVTVD